MKTERAEAAERGFGWGHAQLQWDYVDKRPSSPFLLACEVCAIQAARDAAEARALTRGWLFPLVHPDCAHLLGLRKVPRPSPEVP